MVARNHAYFYFALRISRPVILEILPPRQPTRGFRQREDAQPALP